jgi:hypothetical protein
MSRNNHVFQVLVTKGNQAPIAAGNRVTDLAPGQIGVFDFNTNLSLSAATPSRNFYMAVGLDLDGDTVTDDVIKSRGTHIQGRNSVYYTYRPHTPGQPMKVVLKDYTAECETEYGIKLELRNQEIYRTQGYNQFTKTYSIVTSCCNGCNPTCPSGDANEITKLLKININNDPSGLVVAEAIARQDILAEDVPDLSGDLDAGDVVSDADLEAIMAYNATLEDPANMLYTDLEVTTVPQKLKSFGDLNLQYFYPREGTVIMSKAGSDGFRCSGTIEVTQQAVFEEGAGYDIKQLEFFAKGWDESPYRVSTLNGVADAKFYNTDATVKYDQFVLAYEQMHKNAWLTYSNSEATYIAIPTTDGTTRTGLVAILDALLADEKFDAKADDVAATVASTSTIERTQDKTPATDGIG